MPISRVTLVGAPNTGKSTLFNRLLGRRKALVHSEPGMTRDVNEAPCTLGGRPVLLVDTGGLVGTDDVSLLGGAVRDRVLEVAREASVIVFLVDAKRGLGPQDEDLAALFRKTDRPVILAVNKMESASREASAREFWALGFAPLLEISAEHGQGIDSLTEAILAHLPDEASLEEAETAPMMSIAIAGRPNVGKSSLLNALLGTRRTLVHDQPGTTRDAIETRLSTGGSVWRVIDTAGMRRRGHVTAGPESLSTMAALRHVESADVVIIVMDCTEAPTAQDIHVAGMARDAGRPFLVVLNKWDRDDKSGSAETLVQRVRTRLRFAPYAPILTVSALTGLRVNRVPPLVAEVHEQATRTLSTGKLNRWLQQSVHAHAPSSGTGRELKLQYATQTSTNPPAVLIFTNQQKPPHFSYRRYLENSLRECFRLDLTPVILKFRNKPNTRKRSGDTGHRRRRRAV